MTTVWVVLLVVAVIVWLVRPARKPQPEPWEREESEAEPIDQAELEAAERELEDLDAGEDDAPDRDWGPGRP